MRLVLAGIVRGSRGVVGLRCRIVVRRIALVALRARIVCLVYRGSRIAPLSGRYVFGDFAQTFSNDGRLFYLDETNAIREFPLVDQAELGLSLLGFGQDAQGEIYVLGNGTGTPFGDTGVVLRIGLRPGDLTGDGCVDQSDLGILLAAWMTTADGDLNGDGDTDQSDLGILLSNWGQGCP